MRKKIVLTGGHITPALALIEVLKQVQDDGGSESWEVYFFGRTRAMRDDRDLSLEAKLVPRLGVKFIPLITGRYRRKVNLRNLYSMAKIPVGVIHALILLIKVKPDIVVSFGGYLGLPTVIAAWLLRIPSVIHEQTICAGLANRLSARFATKIAISFPTSKSYFPENKTIFTGNAMAPGIFNKDKNLIKKYTGKFSNAHTIYITTGNQGARDVNKIILEALPKLLTKYNIIHQIGSTESQMQEWKKAQEMLTTLPNNLSNNYFPVKFVPHEERGAAFSTADLIISRGGANTIWDIALLEKPAMIIPLEPTNMDEQLKNARYLEKAGLGKLIREEDLTPDTLINQINKMFDKLKSYKLKSEYRKMFRKDGALKLYELIKETVH